MATTQRPTTVGLSLAEYIKRLTPATCHGDRVAVATIQNAARYIAEHEASMRRVGEASHMYDHYRQQRDAEQRIAESIGFTALSYREG